MFTNARRQPSISSSGSAHSYHVNENDTHDSFSRKMMQEMRADRESRAEAAAAWRTNNTNNTRPIAFGRARKARIRPRVELTVENVERVTVVDDLANDQIRDRSVERFEREASVNSSGGASRHSEPSLNVPRTWARKAKRDNAWLKRLAADLNQSGDLPVHESDPIDWSEAAGDLALPSTEDSPTSRRSSRRGTPASVAAPRPRITSNDQAGRSHEQDSSVDFTLGDAITSTPALVSRNTKLKEIRRREIEQAGWEVIEESALPTPPPEEAVMKHASRNPTDDGGRATKSQENLQNAFTHPAEQDINASRHTIKPLNKPGSFRKRPLFSGPMSPVRTLTKSASTVGTVDREILPEIQKSPERPIHRRQDSRDLLRQWSRAASGTPSPGRAVTPAINPIENPRLDDKEQRDEGAQPDVPGREADIPIIQQDLKSAKSYAPSISSRLSNRENHRPASTRSAESKATSSKPTHPPLKQTKSLPIKLSIPKDPKTPVVTGAWIDTPAPVLAKLPDLPRPRSAASMRNGSLAAGSQKQSDAQFVRQRPSSVPAAWSSARSEEPAERRIPSLPTSALANLVDRAREHGDVDSPADDIDNLGDATMMSLREIIQAPIGDDDTGIETQPRSTKASPSKSRPTAAEKLRAQEIRTLNQMNRRLVEARKNLRDAGDGIDRVERLVKETTVEPTSNAAADSARPSRPRPSVKEDLISEPRFSTHPFRTLWAGGRRMILEDDNIKTIGANKRSKRKPFGPFSRLTWFGLVLMSVLLWGLLEGAACAAFCRPIYSPPTKHSSTTSSPNTLQNPYNLHPNAPTFPTVLPTLALQTVQSIPLIGSIIAHITSLFGGNGRQFASGFPLFELRHDGGSGVESIVPTITKSFARTTTATMVDSFYAAAATTANGFEDLGDWGMEGDEFL